MVRSAVIWKRLACNSQSAFKFILSGATRHRTSTELGYQCPIVACLIISGSAQRDRFLAYTKFLFFSVIFTNVIGSK